MYPECDTMKKKPKEFHYEWYNIDTQYLYTDIIIVEPLTCTTILRACFPHHKYYHRVKFLVIYTLMRLLGYVCMHVGFVLIIVPISSKHCLIIIIINIPHALQGMLL